MDTSPLYVRHINLTTLYRLVSGSIVLGSIVGFALIQRQPLHAFSVIYIDGLSCFTLLIAGLLMLSLPGQWRRIGQTAALGLAMLSGHLMGIAVGLLGVAVFSERWSNRIAGAAMAAGYGLIGFRATSWHLSMSGDGLNSISFLLLLAGVVIMVGALDLPAAPLPPPVDPLATVTGLAALLRLFSVGPWNLGWQLAAFVVGGTLGVCAAWYALTSSDPSAAEEWITRSLGGLAIVAIGCASPAGVAATGVLLGHLTVRRLTQPAAGTSRWAGWLLTGAVPGTLGFVALWSASAAVMAAGVAALAIVVWATALLLMVAGGRQIRTARRWASTVGAGVSLGLGIAAPALSRWLIRPISDQLQGGLTPYGAIEPWGWAGMLALDAGSRIAATAPGVVLLLLMGLIGALAWLISRWCEWV
ncbi:MAG: hypothetical protein KatS3mg055_1542 [Chloroflexus sp.]|uniref:hypothetical protein n=1 Tax=Chloroflexus sp. TaxID=1904827 RepID=UPI0021DEADE6|nr:hypothetical protein [Chloroflexus sp.]GIV89024.1 MAG: hypothetical protein KatS3mg055_1542 [Chloroflexus sp.]